METNYRAAAREQRWRADRLERALKATRNALAALYVQADYERVVMPDCEKARLSDAIDDADAALTEGC